MDADQVGKIMDVGPSRFEEIADTEYSAWYWGDDRCVLFKRGRVVGKDSANIERRVEVGPGSYEETRNAQCLAPGRMAEAGRDRIIHVPGVGTVRIPRSDVVLAPQTEVDRDSDS